MTIATVQNTAAPHRLLSDTSAATSPDARATAAAGGRIRVDARGERLWRVSTAAFAVVGHVELLDTAGGEVFLAKRYSPTYARFVDHGRFWSLEDAVECLRLGR